MTRAPIGEPMRFYRETVLQFHGEECLFWPYARDGKGYAHLRFGAKTLQVHRLVCEDANGPPPSPSHLAAHECGNGHMGCVAPRHLLWKTRSENALDMFRHGRTRVREEHRAFIKANRGLLTQKEIAARLGISKRWVAMIQTGAAFKRKRKRASTVLLLIGG